MPANTLQNPNRSGFTLIELLIVMAIVMLLVSVLIVAIIPALSKGKEAMTDELFTSIKDGITKWRSGEGKPSDAYPKSGVNDTAKPYDGNLMLFRALIGEPEKKGRDPYIKVEADLIGYLAKDGKTIEPNGDKERRIFLDGFGNPIVYWEWASKTRNNVADPLSPAAVNPPSAKELKLAGNKGSYDVYSAGEDGLLGNGDDMSNVKSKTSPFAAASS